MQVSVEQLEGLERRMTVQVPADAVEQKVQSRLQSLTHKARIDGFRPGKVPMKIIKRMYGAQVRQEVLGEVMEQSFQDALAEQQLRPAGGPKVEPLKMEEGQDFEYAATFEVFPDFTPSGIEGQKITRPVAEVSEADIDKMIENLRKQRADWVSVERPAQEKDRVTLSFEGSLNGESFPGGKGENTEVVLGEGRMIAEFEQKLHGLSANTESTFDVQFPADYHSEDLAGKTVQFKVQVHKVEESELPEVDEAFVQAFGIEDGSIDSLRVALRQNMERELQDGVKSYIKNQVMDALLQVNKFPVPQALISSEVETLAQQAGFPDQDDADTRAFKAKMFEDAAKRRVGLGLIVAKLAAESELKMDEDRVRERLENVASSYQDSNEVIRYYRQNPRLMQGIHDLVMEDQVVDWLLESAVFEEQIMSFEEVMKPKRQAPSDAENIKQDSGEDDTPNEQ